MDAQKALYQETSFACSRLITNRYSTSFSLGIRMLSRKYHAPIYGIYGYVRYADEIVDTFFEQNQSELLSEFRRDTQLAIERGFSANPVLHAFQQVVHAYAIEPELVDAFLTSMDMDLHDRVYDQQQYETYIYGSAEAVGLMCLRVFCENDKECYSTLREPARRLGAAFQKVNFLRDIRADYEFRGRTYFPGVDFQQFDLDAKAAIEQDILADFDAAYEGILQLPRGARLGVYTAYIYYKQLFKKICACPASRIMQERIRVPNTRKLSLLLGTYFRHKLNFL